MEEKNREVSWVAHGRKAVLLTSLVFNMFVTQGPVLSPEDGTTNFTQTAARKANSCDVADCKALSMYKILSVLLCIKYFPKFLG